MEEDPYRAHIFFHTEAYYIINNFINQQDFAKWRNLAKKIFSFLDIHFEEEGKNFPKGH